MSVYNFTPSGYINTFLNVTGNTGGPSLGFSATWNGIDQYYNGEPVTAPYSFYGGWTWGSTSLKASYQQYERVEDGSWPFFPL